MGAGLESAHRLVGMSGPGRNHGHHVEALRQECVVVRVRGDFRERVQLPGVPVADGHDPALRMAIEQIDEHAPPVQPGHPAPQLTHSWASILSITRLSPAALARAAAGGTSMIPIIMTRFRILAATGVLHLAGV